MKLTRDDLNVRFRIFERAVLEDQRAYYKREIDRNQRASRQINRTRAFFAFLAGVASLLAALVGGFIASRQGQGACALAELSSIASANLDQAQSAEIDAALSRGGNDAEESTMSCNGLRIFTSILMIVAVGAPALGAAFTTLADLYQWERLASIYETAQKSLAVSDALSPLEEEPDQVYHASLNAFVEGTLSVMRDETSQWGQLVKMPDALQEYIDRARDAAEKDDEEGAGG
ncbi:MAG: hypothetical protein SGJ24_07835 [Chloroflexota bacterium]|nr:hypothetical protein [Chloroflexota bacterium]